MAAGKEKKQRDTNVLHILLVEDDQNSATIILYTLKGLLMPHNIHVAYDGQEALDYIFHTGIYSETDAPLPDLVISDIFMPNIDGCQLYEMLQSREKSKHIPFIALTASLEEHLKAWSKRHGIAGFLNKPLSCDHVTSIIKKLQKSNKL